jgi:hypothetical protein
VIVMKSRVRSLCAGIATAASLIAWSTAGRAQALTPAVPAPEQPTEETRPNRLLLTTGAATIVASYTPAVIVAATSDHKGDKALYAPVAGPWIDLATRGCDRGETVNCGTTTTEAVGLVGMGVAHAAGVAQLVLSLVIPEPPAITVGSAKVEVAPVTFPGGWGVSAGGTF